MDKERSTSEKFKNGFLKKGTQGLLLIATIWSMTSCGPDLKTGDEVFLKEGTHLTYDWNSIRYVKPGCNVKKDGGLFKIDEFSTLGLGQEKESIVYLTPSDDGKCKGWGFRDDLKKIEN